MSDPKKDTKPENPIEDLEPAQDPKGGVLIGLLQPALLPAIQAPVAPSNTLTAPSDFELNFTKK